MFLVIGTLDGWLPAYSDRVGLLTFGGDGVRWAGVALFAAGGILRIWPVFVLGRRFSGLVAIQTDHQLVTDGIYRTIRNPSYLGLLISVVGWALAFRSILGLVLAALFVPILIGRMRSEERLLSGYFGAEYEAYRARSMATHSLRLLRLPMRDLDKHRMPPAALAMGALACGALAVGAMAIGALAIGRLAVGKPGDQACQDRKAGSG